MLGVWPDVYPTIQINYLILCFVAGELAANQPGCVAEACRQLQGVLNQSQDDGREVGAKGMNGQENKKNGTLDNPLHSSIAVVL